MQLCLKPNNNSIAHHGVIPRLHSVIDISYNHPLPGSAHVAVSLDSMVKRAQLHLRPQVESRAKQGLQSACDICMEACCNFIIHQVYLVYLLDPFRALGKKAQKPSRTPLQPKKNGLQVGNSIETYIPFQPTHFFQLRQNAARKPSKLRGPLQGTRYGGRGGTKHAAKEAAWRG